MTHCFWCVVAFALSRGQVAVMGSHQIYKEKTNIFSIIRAKFLAIECQHATYTADPHLAYLLLTKQKINEL